jgi:hypothetical protein
MGWEAGPAWLGNDSYSAETAANARLISAAPDLLAALRTLLTYPSGQYSEGVNFDTAWEAAEAAVAKATGQGAA